MATVGFGSKTRKTDEAPAQAPAKTPAETGSELATRNQETQLGSVLPQSSGFVGSWDRKDIRLPRLNLVHKTSAQELIDAFGIGAFCFNKEVKLSDGKTPARITVLRAAKDYVQKLDFDSAEEPQVFNTPEEVLKAGGSLDYKDLKSGNYFIPRAHMQIITPLPEGVTEEQAALFPYEFQDKAYGMAMFTVASSAYTSVGKELATLCTNNKVMRKGMQYGGLDLTSEIRKNSKNSWHVPVIKFMGENPAELVEFYTSLL